jgi:cbb3-type cytochrome oxidase subunit 3
MDLDVLLWALAFMVGTFAIGGALYGIYHWILSKGRRE